MKPNLQYWLRWEVGLCFLSVLACVAVSFYLLWRYEGTRGRRGTEAAQPGAEGGERSPGVVYDGEAWRPYFNVHLYWLFAYRMASFLFFTTFTVIIVKSRGHTIFSYYTEWTFLLVTLYFGVASWISIYGCRKVVDSSANGENARKAAGFGGYLLQIMYQTAAGAAMLTDTVFWGIICPARLIQHYSDLDILSVVMHSANVVLLLGEAALNSMHFPWFRIAYFCLWTCAYVIFQWTVHASSLMMWPYPFLDLSLKLAPLWYVVAGVMQIPCYLVFGLVIKKLKKHLPLSPSAPVRATA